MRAKNPRANFLQAKGEGSGAKRKRAGPEVRFRFVEGFSDAVRRPVFMTDLL